MHVDIGVGVNETNLPDDMSDRERLAVAFGMLRQAGWFAPTTWSGHMCCSTCGWTEIVHNDPEFAWDTDKSIWWHASADSAAFVSDDDDLPLGADLLQAWKNAEDPEEWVHEHQDEIRASSFLVRMNESRYQYLVDDLALHWSGGKDAALVAVKVLRSVGFNVTPPATEDDCIVIHPGTGRRPLDVTVRQDDDSVVISLFQGTTGPGLVISVEDAVTLAHRILDATADHRSKVVAKKRWWAWTRR